MSLGREVVLDGSREYRGRRAGGSLEHEILVRSGNGSLPELDTCYSSTLDFDNYF